MSSEIDWEKLNPARGDQSPKAGDVWGDRTQDVATGFLVKFVDGFSSPPHIHNVSYRAVVLKGLLHNDDPQAGKMWMPKGSFWTQPAGELHITAARGVENMAYVEIDSGPYLVEPAEEAHDNGERPVNIEARNLVWMDATQSAQIPASSKGPEVALLWEKDGLHGSFLKLPPGFAGTMKANANESRHWYLMEFWPTPYHSPEVKQLDQGSYFTAEGKSVHELRSESRG